MKRKNLFLSLWAMLLYIFEPAANAQQTPAIVEQPASLTIPVGSEASFHVTVSEAPGELRYQWFENGIALPGATSDTYSAGTQTADTQKVYTVAIHYPKSGAIPLAGMLSEPALLTVYTINTNTGLLAHWSFDEADGTNVFDSTGTYHGRLQNGTRIPGAMGGAVEFNGSSTAVIVGGQGTALQLTDTPYSVSWWQRWNGPTASHQDIFAMDDGADYSGGHQAYLFMRSSALYHVHINDGPGAVWDNITQADPGWHHYVITYDGQARHFYRDTILLGSRVTGAPLKSDGDDPFIIGALSLANGTLANFFNGALDDMRIYTRALHQEEIAALGPEPSIAFIRQPKGYRIGQNETVTLSATAEVIASSETIFYQWELNRVAIPDATNATLQVTATGGTQQYRVLAYAGNLERYSDEVSVQVVAPSPARLLLQLDFESAENGIFTDSTGNFTNIQGNATLQPGRIGNSAANLTPGAFVRVPAALTDLELVGSSYTFAWWMKPAASGNANVFSLGLPLTGDTGYGARLEGSSFQRTIRSEHRPAPLASAALRNSTNWVHVAVVYNGLSRTIYTNGVAAAPAAATSLKIRGSGVDDLFIGSTNSSVAVGLIDDFRVYNYALAADELRDLATAPVPAPRLTIEAIDTDMVISWPVSELTQGRLEYAPSLEEGTNWIPLSDPIGSSGSEYEVTQPNSAPQRFYRLRL
jgi:hypothetical protein